MNEKRYRLMPSGRRFYFDDMSKNKFDITEVAHTLGRLCRFGGATDRFYSVSTHSRLVAHIVEDPSLKLMALLHDASEAYIGDIISPVKDLSTRIQTLELEIQEWIMDHFNCDTRCQISHPAIKIADLIALGIEKKIFMPYDDKPWECLRGLEYAIDAHINKVTVNEIISANGFNTEKELFQNDYYRYLPQHNKCDLS